MLCPNCNKAVEEAFMFCPYCSAELDKSSIKVDQEIGSVEGSVSGAVVDAGADAQGMDLSVKQKVDKVESGGAVTGAVVGGKDSYIHVGGEQQYGDTVQGDKVMGDKVQGDKISAGDGSAVAVGEGATAVGAGGVHVGGDVHGSVITGTNVEKVEAGIVNQGGAMQFDAPVKIDMSETTIKPKGDVIQGDQIVMSDDFQGAIVNLKSQLDNASQIITALPYGDDEQKQVFNQLVEQLKMELERIPPQEVKGAEKISKRVEAIARELNEEEPDKDLVEITGKSLLKTAESIAGVLPGIIGITNNIAKVTLALLA